MTGQHVVGYDGNWARPEDDPRSMESPVGELATIREYLSNYRLTLGMKCDDLTPDQLATRSVPPSTLSLLGLIRHMALVEHNWFYRVLQGHLDADRLYRSEEDVDLEFNGAVADPAVVEEARAAWREEIAFAEQFTRDHDLDFVGRDSEGEPVSLRELLVHMIEEYARHNGHADLLRERIDGRVGE